MPGKPSASRSTLDVLRDHAEILGDHGQLAELGLRRPEDRLAGAGKPAAGASVELVRSLRNRPEGGEPAEVIDPGEVVQRERPPQPLDPPAVALLGEHVPVEERIAPVLPQRAEPVRRRAGQDTLQEELRMGQLVDAVLGDIDRDVADQPDAALAGVLAQRRPLAVEPNLVGGAPACPLPV